MAELCLGTVQFGMKYGINNKLGQPSEESSISMIDYAVKHGVKYIDTARAYGTAELVVGKYIKEYGLPSDVNIISKLRPNVIENENQDIDAIVRRECEDSLKRLHVSKLNGYLLHTPEYIYNQDIINALMKLKEEKLVDNIGVSIYDIKEGNYAIETGMVDYIQLPYSILDQRGMRTGFIPRAKRAGIKIFTRSAFLQGLILMEKENIPEHLTGAISDIINYEKILEQYQVDNIKTLMHFITEEKEIDYLVFGVDTKEQLEKDIQAYQENQLPEGVIENIKEKITNLDESIIFPSLWSNGKKAE